VYSAATVARSLDVRRAGDAGAGAARGEAGNPACGDAVRIELRVRKGVIAAARHRTFGCPHATAAAAAACELVEGSTPLAAARLGAAGLERELESGPRAAACVAVAADALHAAIAVALEAQAVQNPVPGRIAVAMSGGVDSAVALVRAVEAGLEPVGVTLRLWIDPAAPDGDRACCSPRSVRAARDACHALGVPHIGLDLREPFRRAVVDDFVAAHARGRTPNPCVRCNGAFRFAALAAFADRIGAARIATGHYARIERRGGRTLVARAADHAKDQSYMLATVPEPVLGRCWFPLGGQTKAETRAEARAAGLAAAGRRDSQEACFVGGGDHRDFVERHGGAGPAGDIVDPAGAVLGRHGGLHRFTPGQRRGLGLAGTEPLYVLRAEPDTGRLVVGPRDRLGRRAVRVEPGRMFVDTTRVRARLRSRQEPVWATVTRDGDALDLRLDEPVDGVAAGQAAVLYDGDAVVGAGTIA
jgi:tRNA-uridine 2-sulfurtransferase